MVRKLLRYKTDEFKKEFAELQNSLVEIYFDIDDPKDFQKINEVLKQAGAKKVKRIMAVILKTEYLDHTIIHIIENIKTYHYEF